MTYPRNATIIDPQKLDRLAEVAVKVGLGLQEGQDLVMTAPVAALPLVHTAWVTAIVFSIANAILLLRFRIPVEEHALATVGSPDRR